MKVFRWATLLTILVILTSHAFVWAAPLQKQSAPAKKQAPAGQQNPVTSPSLSVQGSQPLAMKPDLVIKSFSLNPVKPTDGSPFNLLVEIGNQGAAASAAGQQYAQSCKVVSGSSTCPVPSATGVLPMIPAHGTYKITLPGLKGKQGSYEVTIKLLPERAHNAKSFVFSIEPKNSLSPISMDSKMSTKDGMETIELPKKTFFDLYVKGVYVACMDCKINHDYAYYPNSNPPGTKNIYVVPDKRYRINASYSIAWPPVEQITEADAKYWGSGRLAVDLSLSIRPPYWCDVTCIAKTKATIMKYTPPFTFDIIRGYAHIPEKSYGASIEWKPSKEDIGKTFIPNCRVFPHNNEWFDVNSLNNTETDYPVIHVVAELPQKQSGGVVPATKTKK